MGSNLNNLCMHLTNYAINQRNKGVFEFNTDSKNADIGHKRTMSSIYAHIQANYDNGEKRVIELKTKIENILINTILAV